uniref:Dual specificity protein phosphatase 19 n=1 Tax=Anthurium amnicola TaxID=1678845 RepID=A0A1D1ZL88_9ARAE
MAAPDSPGGGTPRKSLWRSASWSARSSPTTNPTSAATDAANPSTTSITKPRSSLPLPPLSVSRRPQAWPLPAPADSSPSPAASSLVDGDLSRVTDQIYLGGDAAARDHDLLRRHGITHVLNCAGFACPERFAGELRYKTLWLRDHPGEDIASLLYGAFDFLEEAIAAGRGRGRVLVHCARGTSRSAAIVVAYLMWRRAFPFDEALGLVRAARAAADPNPGFVSQLLQCQRRVLASPPSPWSRDASPRTYRMAPHSPYDPLHLVPKTVDCSGPGELDSRGAFLVHAPAAGSGAVYVWVGADCDTAMATSAGTAARQVLRYERARGPIVAVDEGSEPAEFWDALGCSVDGRGSSAAPRRRVESYDLDFEIYRRALRGVATAAELAPSPEAGLITTPRTTVNRSNGDHNGAAVPFGSPSSFSGGSATPTSSDGTTLSTFSPASSSSDWFNSSPGSDLPYREAPSLSPSRPPPPPRLPALVERRGAAAPSPLLWPRAEEGESAGDAERDWLFSPYPRGNEEDDGAMDIDQGTPCELGQTVEVQGAALYHWQPHLEKVETLHPGVLDSESVFLLLSPERSSGSGVTKTLFVWVGRDYQLTHGDDGEDMEEDGQAYFKKIGHDFLDQMTLPFDIPIQVIREDEEPEEFLNHLFTFHQIKESSKD